MILFRTIYTPVIMFYVITINIIWTTNNGECFFEMLNLLWSSYKQENINTYVHFADYYFTINEVIIFYDWEYLFCTLYKWLQLYVVLFAELLLCIHDHISSTNFFLLNQLVFWYYADHKHADHRLVIFMQYIQCQCIM